MPSSYSSPRRGQRSQSSRRPLRSTHSGSPQKSQRSTSNPHKKASETNFFKKVLAFFGIRSSPKSIAKKISENKTTRTGSGRIARTPRKPEQVEVTSPRLYIGNLSFDATESDLFELFSGIGQVQNVELVSNRDTHRSKGFGFVQMTVLEEAKRAVKELHDKEYMGRKLVVSGAKALPEGRMESRNESRSEELPQSS
jgi:RNA recognition motif-containing protein